MSAPQRQMDSVLDGKYRLLFELAASSFGAVYEAEDLGVGKHVVVKVLRRNVDAPSREIFFNAARALARITHPSLVSILALGGDEEHAPYVVMEYLTGETLHALVTRDGPISPGKVAELALDLLSGLAALHAGGVLHGNLSPKNVFVTYPRPQRPQLKLLGLGVPRVCRESARETGPFEIAAGAAESSETRSSPESASVQADLRAACATLFFLATGRSPTSSSPALLALLPDSIRECVTLGLGNPETCPSGAAELLQLVQLTSAAAPEPTPGVVRGYLLNGGRAQPISRPPRAALLQPQASDRLVSDSLLVSPRVPRPPASPRLKMGLDFMPSPGEPLLQEELERRRLPTQVPQKNRWTGAVSATALGFTVGVVLARLLGLI